MHQPSVEFEENHSNFYRSSVETTQFLLIKCQKCQMSKYLNNSVVESLNNDWSCLDCNYFQGIVAKVIFSMKLVSDIGRIFHQSSV